MGRQLLAFCTTALVCILLACVGPLCVVLFVPTYKVKRGAWNKNHSSFWRSVSCAAFSCTPLHRIFILLRRLGHTRLYRRKRLFLRVRTSASVSTLQCLCCGSILHEEESRYPVQWEHWLLEKVLCHYADAHWRSLAYVYTKQNHLSWLKVFAHLKSTFRSWCKCYKLWSLWNQNISSSMEAQPLLLHPIAALLAHWLVIQLLLESQDKITQRAVLHGRHLLLVSESLLLNSFVAF